MRINSGHHRTIQAVLLVFAYLLPINIISAVPDAVSLAVGKGNNTINVAKTGARKHFTHYWFDTNTGRLTGYWELSLGYWHETQDHTFTLGLSPVFVYEFRPMASGHQFYINGGIGVALISETQIGERDLASAFQFEDQIGLGLRFGTKRQHDMNFGFLHYSNAKIQPPNDGIDIWLFTYTHWLESHR